MTSSKETSTEQSLAISFTYYLLPATYYLNKSQEPKALNSLHLYYQKSIMTQRSRKLLIVEIRIANETDFDSSQVQSLTIYRDSENHYHSNNQMKEIKRAMGDAIVYFGNNYRHPLLYDVQVVSGDNMDAVMASVERHPNAHRRRRKGRRTGN